MWLRYHSTTTVANGVITATEQTKNLASSPTTRKQSTLDVKVSGVAATQPRRKPDRARARHAIGVSALQADGDLPVCSLVDQPDRNRQRRTKWMGHARFGTRSLHQGRDASVHRPRYFRFS